MPHLTVEYSANLDGRTDVARLCDALLATLLDTKLFEVGAVRVRAIRCEAYAIADRLPDNAFIDLNLRIGKGRSDEEKKRTGEALFACATQMLSPLFETPHFALSLEIREIDAALSWKKNAIHPRLRSQ